jgi:hypothetical protein
MRSFPVEVCIICCIIPCELVGDNIEFIESNIARAVVGEFANKTEVVNINNVLIII